MAKKKPKDYLKEPYARILIPDENGGFYAEILEFPGCFAEGATPDETFANLEDAAESWIQACINHGQEIPGASSKIGFSGKIALRLPKSIHRQAVRIAERDGTSLNQFLLSAISARVGADDLYNLMAQRLENRLVATAFNLTNLAESAFKFYSQQESVEFPVANQIAEAATTKVLVQ